MSRALLLERLRPVALGVLGIALALGLWEFAVSVRWLNVMFTSRPSLIGIAIWRGWLQGDVAFHAWVTLQEFLIGYGASVIAGVLTAMLMAASRRLEYSLDFFIWFFYNAPLVAFYPLLIIWLGLGRPTVIAICFLLSYFPIVINALAGFKSVEPRFILCARSFGHGKAQILRKVMLPAAMPMILTGLRIAVGRALIGVTVGELFGANAGIGFLIARSSIKLQTTQAMAGIAVIVALGVCFTSLLSVIERRFDSWRTS